VKLDAAIVSRVLEFKYQCGIKTIVPDGGIHARGETRLQLSLRQELTLTVVPVFRTNAATPHHLGGIQKL
jgi:hypothetical protein